MVNKQCVTTSVKVKNILPLVIIREVQSLALYYGVVVLMGCQMLSDAAQSLLLCGVLAYPHFT